MSRSRANQVGRRNFIRGSLAGAAWLASGGAAPGVFGAAGQDAPSRPPKVSANEKLNVAVVGAGGRGVENINDLLSTGAANIVALCDCDAGRAADTFERFPKAKRYRDWRKLLDEAGDTLDAVLCATPDHNHAVVSVAAMGLGKHVYCEKPLAHSVCTSVATVPAVAKNRLVSAHRCLAFKTGQPTPAPSCQVKAREILSGPRMEN